MSYKGSVVSSPTSKHDIVKVLEHYGFVISTNRGGWVSVRCVFHNDHVKSARLNIDLGGFRCFACDMAGDVYSIIMKREGVNYGEALKIAERITGESNGELRRKPKRSTTVSSESRDNRDNGAYVPPRLRGES
jgi:DNA primase